MKVDLDELERIARAAKTEHRWRVYRCRSADLGAACGIKSDPFVSEGDDTGQRGVVFDTAYDECHHHMALADAEHVAASDPATQLALIARIRELEGGFNRAVGEVLLHNESASHVTTEHVLGDWRALLEKGAVLP